MKKPFPALCKDCKYSTPKIGFTWNNLCLNPKVVSKDPWAMSNNFEGGINGSMCNEERSRKSWFAPCGMKGKLWEPIING